MQAQRQIRPVIQIKPTKSWVIYIFILKLKNLSKKQQQQIKNLYHEQSILRQGHIFFNPLGQNVDNLLEKIKFLEQQNDRFRPSIKVIADLQNAKQILMNKISQINEINIISQVSDFNNLQLQLDYPTMINEVNSLDYFIIQVKKKIQIQKIKEQPIRNSINLNDKNWQKILNFTIKTLAMENLPLQKFQSYLHKFETFLQGQIIRKNNLQNQNTSRYSLSNINPIISQLEQAINKYKEIKQSQQILKNREHNSPADYSRQQTIQQQFIKKMFDLYKKQGFFYEILNQGIRKISKSKEKWESLALPYSLMDKAIKMRFNRPSNQKKINQNTGQTIVWRGGLMNKQEFDQMKNNILTNPFYTFFSFLSCSLDINVALQFIKPKQKIELKYNCLFKFTIKQSNNTTYFQNSYFFNHGYAFIQDIHQKSKEKQVLINSSTAGKITSIQTINRSDLQKLIGFQNVSLDNYNDNTKLIQMQIGSFQQIFHLNNIKQLTSNYNYMMHQIMKIQSLSIADVYQMCNDLEKAYTYFKSDLKELVSNNNHSKNAFKQRLILFLKLSSICRKMGHVCQANLFNNLAFEAYKIIQTLDKHRIYKLHNDRVIKIYKKIPIYIEGQNSIQINKIIRSLIKQLQNEYDVDQKQYNKVLIANLLLQLGFIHLKEGSIKIARETFQQSALKMQEVFYDIYQHYDGQQTFYFDYFIGLLIMDPHVSLREGTAKYFQYRRKLKLQQKTKKFGGLKIIQTLRHDILEYEYQVAKIITQFSNHFHKSTQYESIMKQYQTLQNYSQIQNLNKLDIKITKKLSKQQSLKSQMNLDFNNYSQTQNFNQKQQNKHKNQIIQKMKLLKQLKKISCINQQDKQSFKNNISLSLSTMEKDIQDKIILSQQKIGRQFLQFINQNKKIIQQHLEIRQQLGQPYPKTDVLNDLLLQSPTFLRKQLQNQAQIINKNKKYHFFSTIFLNKAKIYLIQSQIDFLRSMKHDLNEKSNPYLISKYQLQLQKINSSLQMIEKSIQYYKKAFQQQTQKNYQITTIQIQIYLLKNQCLLKQYQILVIINEQQQNNNKKKLQQIYKSLINLHHYINKLQLVEAKNLSVKYQQIYGLFCFNNKQYIKSYQAYQRSIKIRQTMIGYQNWLKIMTSIKVIYMFHMVDKLHNKLQKYLKYVSQCLTKHKNLSLYWKICVADYFIKKNSTLKSQQKKDILRNALHSIQKAGFIDKYISQQYEILYDFQYRSYLDSHQDGTYKLKLHQDFNECKQQNDDKKQYESTKKEINVKNIFKLKRKQSSNKGIYQITVPFQRLQQFETSDQHIKLTDKKRYESIPSPNMLETSMLTNSVIYNRTINTKHLKKLRQQVIHQKQQIFKKSPYEDRAIQSINKIKNPDKFIKMKEKFKKLLQKQSLQQISNPQIQTSLNLQPITLNQPSSVQLKKRRRRYSPMLLDNEKKRRSSLSSSYYQKIFRIYEK